MSKRKKKTVHPLNGRGSLHQESTHLDLIRKKFVIRQKQTIVIPTKEALEWRQDVGYLLGQLDIVLGQLAKMQGGLKMANELIEELKKERPDA